MIKLHLKLPDTSITDQVMDLAEKFFADPFNVDDTTYAILLMGKKTIKEFCKENNIAPPGELRRDDILASRCLGKIETVFGSFYLHQSFHENELTAMIIDEPYKPAIIK